MERVVTDQNNTTWTCIQAFTGLSDGEENQEAAKVKGKDDAYWVVCTPDGGAQSVRIQLAGNWDQTYSDADLLVEIQNQQQSQ